MKYAKMILSMIIIMSVSAEAHARRSSSGGGSSTPKPKATPFVGGTVNCVDAKVSNGPVIWSYVVKTTKSLRLGSDILYNDGTSTTIISSLSVAQYASSKDSLYMMIDDVNENPTHIFSAVKPLCGTGVTFTGTLQLIDIITGNVASTKSLKCSVAQ